MKITGALLVSALALFAATAELAAQIRNYQAPGALESTPDLGCVGPAKLHSKLTPADLYGAVERCVRQGTYREVRRYSCLRWPECTAATTRCGSPTTGPAASRAGRARG